MAVYKKTYARYEGRLTPAWSRTLVIPRYAFEEMRRSRFLTLFFLAGLIQPLLAAVFLYLRHNLAALTFIGLRNANFGAIDSRFFLAFIGWQGMVAFFAASFVGPGQISPDLANNALALYLSRPFSRAEYLLGKLSVLLVLLSALTWVPGLLLYALQAYLEGNGWGYDNLRIAGALFLGSLIWILVLSLLALALSAWVKWKPAAGALIFGSFFVAAGFGEMVNAVLKTRWGHLINISHLIGSVWVNLFDRPMRRGAGAVFFRVWPGEEIPQLYVWGMLIAICLFCLYLLTRKIRATEVVR